MDEPLWQFPQVGLVSSLGPTEQLVEEMGDAEAQEASGEVAGFGSLVGCVSGAGDIRSLADGIVTCGWSIRAG